MIPLCGASGCERDSLSLDQGDGCDRGRAGSGNYIGTAEGARTIALEFVHDDREVIVALCGTGRQRQLRILRVEDAGQGHVKAGGGALPFGFVTRALNPERKLMPEDTRPATKQDLNQLREELVGQMHDQITEFRDQLVEQMRDMQTEVLRAFHDWASPVEIKLRAIPPLDQRLDLIEERVSRLERGKLQH